MVVVDGLLVVLDGVEVEVDVDEVDVDEVDVDEVDVDEVDVDEVDVDEVVAEGVVVVVEELDDDVDVAGEVVVSAAAWFEAA